MSDATRFGQLAVAGGQLPLGQLLAGLARQRDGDTRPLGEVLLSMGALDESTRDAILRRQVTLRTGGSSPTPGSTLEMPEGPAPIDDREMAWLHLLESARRAGPAPVPGGIGDYPILDQLGRGGMGEVLLVEDRDIGRQVAAKRLLGQPQPHQREQFLREVRITGQLEHPGVVPVYTAGRDEHGAPFFVMKRVSGDELGVVQARLHGTPGGLQRLLQMFLKVCETVGFAHSRGVIHRDLKPSNVMVGEFGEVYVMDWGLSKALGAAEHIAPGAPGAHASETADGMVKGTPAYMAPEQARGDVEAIGPLADIYALGALLYHLLCGHSPFGDTSTWLVLSAVASGEPPPPPSERTGVPVPGELEAIVRRAMSVDPSDRYPDAAALQADVEAFLEGRLVSVARYHWTQRALRWARRHRLAVAVLLAVGLTGVVAASLVARQQRGKLDTARAAVAALSPDDLLARARRFATSLPASPRGVTPAERRRGTRLIQQLMRLGEAEAQLVRLGGQDRRRRALAALGRVAQRSEDFALAESAFLRLEELGHDAGPLLARLTKARGARLRAHRDHIQTLLDRAGAGGLADVTAYRQALLTIASYRETQTVALLQARLGALTTLLLDAARARMSRDASPAERQAIERFLLAQRPYDTPPPSPSRQTVTHMNAVFDRLSRADPRHEGRGESQGSWRQVLALAQRRALDRGGRQRSRELQLCTEALGLLGDTQAIASLVDALFADWDERRAIVAGRALVALGQQAPRRVGSALSQVVGGRSEHFSTNGAWASAIIPIARPLLGAAEAGRGSDQTTPGDLLERGLAAEEAGDVQGARAFYDQALRLDPRYIKALVNRGLLHGAAGRTDAALADYDAALAIDPAFANALINRAQLHIRLGNLDRAMADARAAVANHPDNLLAYGARARVFTARGLHDRALADWDRVVARQPGSVDAIVARGRARLQTGDRRGALADFSHGIQLDPDNPLPHVNRGALRLDTGDHAGAIADCSRAIELGASIPHPFATRGEAYRLTGDVERALTDLRKAITLDPDHAVAHARLSIVLYDRRERPAALTAARRAVALDVRMAPAHQILGNLASDANQPAAAIAHYTRAIAHTTPFAGLHISRGWCRQRTGDLKGARADFDRALEISPGNPRATGLRGLLRLRTGDAGGRADLDRAIADGCTLAQVHTGRADLRLRARDLEGAATDARRALQLDETSGQAHYILGFVCLRTGQREQAVGHFRRCTRLSPRQFVAWQALGETLANLGRGAEALPALRTALGLAPDAAARARIQARLDALRK